MIITSPTSLDSLHVMYYANIPSALKLGHTNTSVRVSDISTYEVSSTCGWFHIKSLSSIFDIVVESTLTKLLRIGLNINIDITYRVSGESSSNLHYAINIEVDS